LLQPLKNFLGIQKIHISIGGSMGGHCEWAISNPIYSNLFFYHNQCLLTWAIAFNDPSASMKPMEAEEKHALASISE
jgi:homoserine acetyltransferase